MKDFKDKLKLVPSKPGCYQMKDVDGNIIYVGKAKDLSKRLKSYFTGSHDAKTTKMVSMISDFEYIITSTEKEAFLLELNFIKEYRPKYNILLMDSKTYPYICITNDVHPRVIMTREIGSLKRKNKNKLFGPFPNAKACKDTVEIINKLYPLRKCKNIPKKYCLYYTMNECLAPCVNKINNEVYNPIINNITRFLNGYDTELINTIKEKMENAAESLEFEKAIEYRNMLNSLESLQDKQKMTLSDGVNRDIFGYAVKDELINIQIFHMRNGRIIERTGEVFDLVDTPQEMLISYIVEFYSLDNSLIPSEVLIPYIEDLELLKDLLGTKVYIPIKGIKKQLVELVKENAKNNLDNIQKERLIKISKTTKTLEELASLLNIKYPRVIELFDNSNIQGASSVSAMVTYIDGVPSYKDYRKYKIKTIDGADDYHTMQEVSKRRYTRVLKENLRKPNLIIADGGKTQVKAIKEVLDELGIKDIDLIGLVKDDKHRTRAIVNSFGEEIAIDKKSNLFLLLEAMQNEVHRFAITFFQKVHTESLLSSRLDTIEGIGKKRKQILLEHFDNVEAIKKATIEELHFLGFSKDISEKLLKSLNE